MTRLFQNSSSWLSSFSDALNASSVSNQANRASGINRKKLRKLTNQRPTIELPDWMLNPPTIEEPEDIVMPDVPEPDPMAELSVSTGEERRLRRKRKGLLSAIGAGNTGGWMGV